MPQGMSQCAYAIFGGDTRSSSVRRECIRAMVAAKPARYLNVRRSFREVVLCRGFSSEVRCLRGRVRTVAEGARDVARAVDPHIATSIPSGESTRKKGTRYVLGSKGSRQNGGRRATAPLGRSRAAAARSTREAGRAMTRGAA